MIEIIKEIVKKTGEKALQDNEDFCPADTGNYDDVFEMGIREGKIYYAEEIIAKLRLELESVATEKLSTEWPALECPPSVNDDDMYNFGLKDSKILLAREFFKILETLSNKANENH